MTVVFIFNLVRCQISKSLILNFCDDETFYWLSEVFEDVAGKTRSKDLINALVKRCERVSDAEKRRSIESEIVADKEAL